MHLGFNHHFYRRWPFWVGLGFLFGDAGLRLLGVLMSDPLGVMIGLLWLAIGLFTSSGSHPAS